MPEPAPAAFDPYAYTMTDAPPVTLGRTTYRVETQTMHASGNVETWLHGPRGAVYFLRPYLGPDAGLRQVISWKSGSELRVNGNRVRVYLIGDRIEVAR